MPDGLKDEIKRVFEIIETLKLNGYSVADILNETDLSSDRDDALATQKAIKAYVDASAGGAVAYPKRWIGFHDSSLILAGNPLVIFNNTSQNWFSGAYQDAPQSDLDSFSQSLVIASGTYTFRVFCIKVPDAPKVDWYLDDTKVITGMDFYDAGGVLSQVLTDTIIVPTSGLHKLVAVVNGRNVSSSGYRLQLTKMELLPAAD